MALDRVVTLITSKMLERLAHTVHIQLEGAQVTSTDIYKLDLS